MNDIITNGAEIKQRIISEINNSRQIINLAMAWFTDRDIANAIIDAKKRNVFVDVILSSNSQNESVKILFESVNILVHAFDTGDERGMMHHKFCLIDNKISINGSYNYSYNASNNNVENIQVSDNFETYRQLLAEFERMKYNIDNNTSNINNYKTQSNMNSSHNNNSVDLFAQNLQNLVFSTAQIDTLSYKNDGYKKSKESNGSLEIFKSEYLNIKEQMEYFVEDDNILSKKNILTTYINSAYESKKLDIDLEKNSEINTIKNKHDFEIKLNLEKIKEHKDNKAKLEVGQPNIGEKGLFQINTEIEKNKIEKRSLEQTLILKKFARPGTILTLLFLSICIFYLSIFFASALYKVFFEGNVIRASLTANITPALPQIIDANAIIKIFSKQGWLFGFISMFIFLFPLALTNLKILGSSNKLLNTFCFWIGLVVFDILVSGMVAINTDKIEALLTGTKSTIQFWEVIKHGEFYLIFIFGMLPLFITHFLIDYIIKAYNESRSEFVDAEKARRLEILDYSQLELVAQKEILSLKVKEFDELIETINNKITEVEKSINLEIQIIENKYLEISRQIKSIVDDYITKILSGKLFTDVVLNSIISSFKTGFVEYLPEYYADNEVAKRVREIENIITTN